MNLVFSLYDSFKSNKENNAFCIDKRFYTYGELLVSINRIRKNITEKIGANEESIVGLVTNNDLETYATIFSLWMEGKAYLPINPNAPISRNKKILNSINAKYVFDSSKTITDAYSLELIKTSGLENNAVLNCEPVKLIEENIAYILFTSGSTGTPKGIPISFKNLNALFTELDNDKEYKLNSTDRCLQMYDLTFDASLTALLPALLVGACVYTVPSTSIKYLYIFQLLVNYKLTVLKMVPSIIYYLRPYFPEIIAPSVRYCVFGGEKLYEDILDEWRNCVPNSKILNHYGPTEFTVCSGYYDYKLKESNKSHNGVVSIGKPFKNVDYLIVNDNNNEVSNNEEGELCLSGDQLTSGYFNNTELNKTSFFMYKASSGVIKRFYKTGDLCLTDGEHYMYIGRKDFQVKIGGYRVELGEVEYHVRNHESIKSKNILVIDIKTSKNKIELVLVVENCKFDTKALTKFLTTKLADYMIPKKIFFIDKLPYNSHGKLDRKKIRNLIKTDINNE